MKIVPYTATVGDYLERKDILCFHGEGLFKTNVMEAKIYKVLPHQFIDCDVSIWVDGNIYLNNEPERIVDDLLGDFDMALFMHPCRINVFQEIKFFWDWTKLNSRLDLLARSSDQANYYESKGWGNSVNLHECGILIRRHNNATKAFNESWWSEICRWTERDQASFPVAVERCPVPIKVNTIMMDHRKHPFFKY